MIKSSLVLAMAFFGLIANAVQTSFSKDEIVFPKGKIEIVKFLDLMKDPQNRNLVQLEDAKPSYKELPSEGSATFSIGGTEYLLYFDDFSNEGSKEYFLIYITSGSGSYSGVRGAYKLKGDKLESMHFDKIVIKNLFPTGDMSRFHTRLARPFAVRIHGKIYMRFLENQPESVVTYRWDGQAFSKQDL